MGRLGRTQSTDGGNAEKTIQWGAALPQLPLAQAQEGGHEVPISHWTQRPQKAEAPRRWHKAPAGGQRLLECPAAHS